jgi:hypothetical protein
VSSREAATLARTRYLPQIRFTEDISRGNDPVNVFSTRLRQQRFTQTDLALAALNTPDLIGKLRPPESLVDGFFRFARAQKSIHSANSMHKSASVSDIFGEGSKCNLEPSKSRWKRIKDANASQSMRVYTEKDALWLR